MKINTARVIAGLSGILMLMAICAALTNENIIALTYGIAAIWGMMAANFRQAGDK